MSADRDIGKVKSAADEMVDAVHKRAEQSIEKMKKTTQNAVDAFDVVDEFTKGVDTLAADLQASFATITNFPPAGPEGQQTPAGDKKTG